MRKIFLAVFLVVSMFPLWSKPIDENTALKVAVQVLFAKQANVGETQQKNEKPQPLKLVYKSSNETIVYFYVFTTQDNGSFVIVSGDDRVPPVLGYSLSNGFSVENMPDNVAWWLGEYAKQIAYAIEKDIEPEQEVKQQWDNYLKNVENNEKENNKYEK